MLNIHIGTPKTGTTAIQGFLQSNKKLLKLARVHYAKAGRANIAHNAMATAFRKGQGQNICDKIVGEIADAPRDTHILSSELFFRATTAQAFAEHLPPKLKRRTRVICYIRRQDKYLEALYKQLVKNGRIPPNPMAFYKRRQNHLTYSDTLNAYADVFGVHNVIVRPFERQHFPEGDVVDDFAATIGLKEMRRFQRAAETSNKTLSVDVSEMLGMISRNTNHNTRQIIRDIIHHAPKDAFNSGDVFTKPARAELMKLHADDNEAIRQKFCPDVHTLFDLADLEENVPDPLPDATKRLALNKSAVETVLQSIARLEAEKQPA